MPEISIICTFYSAVDYLPLTVKSILNSTFTDFELLLVDDGGPNGCGKICDVLAETDPRIRVFHKENGGPASAANVGLKNAVGRYITFMDSDDLMEPNKLQRLYDAIRQSGASIAACGADSIDEDGMPIPGYNEVVCSLTGKIDALELFRDAFSTGSFYGPLSWNKLFEARVWKEKGIFYDEKMFFGDDASVLHKVFEGETCFCMNDKLHHYRSRRGSMTNTTFPLRKTDDLIMYYDWVKFFQQKSDYQDIYKLGLARYWDVFYKFYVLASEAGVMPQVADSFAFHLNHLKELKPAILTCGHVSAFEKFRLRLFCRSPKLAYDLARLWGKLHGEGKP